MGLIPPWAHRMWVSKRKPFSQSQFVFVVVFAHIGVLNYIYFLIFGCAGSLLLYRLSPVTGSRGSY